MNSVITLIEDQNPEGNKAGSHQENHLGYILSIVFIHVVCVSCVLTLLHCCLKYKTIFPSGMRAEALGIFFWQMVISN